MSASDLQKAIGHYRNLAPRYDYFTRRINRIRQRTIAALSLQPGETVLDAGCGTGYCFEFIEQAIGNDGKLVAFEPSPDMLAIARNRLAEFQWRNTSVIEARAESVVFPSAPDAILFSYTHDILRSRKALENLFAQSKQQARVAATGTKLYAKWLVPGNAYIRYSYRHYVTNFDGLERPWDILAEYLQDFRVETHPFTQHYVATGRLR